MKYISLILIFLVTSCSSPKEHSEEWFLEKLSDPDWEYREDFKEIMQSMKDDARIIDKYSINYWLNKDDFLDSYDTSPKATYLKTLKLCAANFAVMYGFIEAGKLHGTTLRGIVDANEMNVLSSQYDNHAHYFYSRALEIETADFDDTNWESDELSYYEIKEGSIGKEIAKIRDEIFLINSNEDLIQLMESNEELCIQVRNQNPNNQEYKIDS